MAKRSWAEANPDSSPNVSPSSNVNNVNSSEPRQRPRKSSGPTSASGAALAITSPKTAPSSNGDALSLQTVPNISRKVKACAACRKQKV